jgi:hypothetical protein
VQITAAAAKYVIDSVINNKGVIEANTVGQRGGTIVLSAATGKSKPSGAPAQNVKLAGTISAAGKNAGQTGGTIKVTGENISMSGSRIDASGQTGGGAIPPLLPPGGPIIVLPRDRCLHSPPTCQFRWSFNERGHLSTQGVYLCAQRQPCSLLGTTLSDSATPFATSRGVIR